MAKKPTKFYSQKNSKELLYQKLDQHIHYKTLLVEIYKATKKPNNLKAKFYTETSRTIIECLKK